MKRPGARQTCKRSTTSSKPRSCLDKLPRQPPKTQRQLYSLSPPRDLSTESADALAQQDSTRGTMPPAVCTVDSGAMDPVEMAKLSGPAKIPTLGRAKAMPAVFLGVGLASFD